MNVPDLLKRSEKSDAPLPGGHKSIKGILRDRGLDFGSTFHNEGGTNEDHLENGNVYVDLGEDSPEERKEGLSDLLQDARSNGLCKSDAERLKGIRRKYQGIQ